MLTKSKRGPLDQRDSHLNCPKLQEIPLTIYKGSHLKWTCQNRTEIVQAAILDLFLEGEGSRAVLLIGSLEQACCQ